MSHCSSEFPVSTIATAIEEGNTGEVEVTMVGAEVGIAGETGVDEHHDVLVTTKAGAVGDVEDFEDRASPWKARCAQKKMLVDACAATCLSTWTSIASPGCMTASNDHCLTGIDVVYDEVRSDELEKSVIITSPGASYTSEGEVRPQHGQKAVFQFYGFMHNLSISENSIDWSAGRTRFQTKPALYKFGLHLGGDVANHVRRNMQLVSEKVLSVIRDEPGIGRLFEKAGSTATVVMSEGVDSIDATTNVLCMDYPVSEKHPCFFRMRGTFVPDTDDDWSIDNGYSPVPPPLCFTTTGITCNRKRQR